MLLLICKQIEELATCHMFEVKNKKIDYFSNVWMCYNHLLHLDYM